MELASCHPSGYYSFEEAPTFLKHLVQFPYWVPTIVRIHNAKFRSLPHDLAVVPNVCGFL